MLLCWGEGEGGGGGGVVLCTPFLGQLPRVTQI